MTLKPISDPIMDFGKSKFEIANQTLSDEGLKGAGVSDPAMFKTLGIFGFVIVILLILMLVYFVLKWTTNAVRSKKVGLLVKTLTKIKDAMSVTLPHPMQIILKIIFKESITK